MRGPHNIWRLIRTGATLERTGAMQVVLDAFDAPAPLRFVARTLGLPFKFLGYKGDPSMPPATRALTALGPAYIKFGQVLSTRPDVVGDELAVQLRVLQDKLPPFSIEQAKAEVERELGRPVDRIFSEFSEPVAAASIAQVHRARLLDTGEDVAVKVLRPNVERAFRKDVDAFYLAARMVELFSPGSRRLRPMDVIEHFDGVVRGELDLRLESSAASEFAANTVDDEGFQLPAIKWNHSSRRVMTLEWADGVPMGDNAAIDEYTRRVYAEILYGFIRRDYKRVAKVHFEAGYVPADKDVDEFARALRAVGEPIFGMDASHISMARLLSYLFEVTERFGMETRTELILLQRTMVVVEGVARSLNPNINIWEVASPIVTSYITKSIGPRAVVNDLANTAKVLARFGPRLPALVESALLQQSNPTPPPRGPRKRWFVLAAAGGAVAAAAAIALVDALT
jgi:ubiquinone biosynthesis protein